MAQCSQVEAARQLEGEGEEYIYPWLQLPGDEVAKHGHCERAVKYRCSHIVEISGWLVFYFTFYVESGTQLLQVFRTVAAEADADGYTLLYLDEVAGGVVLRYQ